MTDDLDHLYALAEGVKEARDTWNAVALGTVAYSDARETYMHRLERLNAALSPDVVKGLIERVREAEAKVRSDALDRLAEIDAPLIAPDTPARPDREAVARVIDPEAFAYFDKDAGQHNDTDLLRFEVWRKDAFAKADAILALIPPADGWRSIDTAPRGVICEQSPEDCCGEPDACRMTSPLDAKEGGR